MKQKCVHMFREIVTCFLRSQLQLLEFDFTDVLALGYNEYVIVSFSFWECCIFSKIELAVLKVRN